MTFKYNNNNNNNNNYMIKNKSDTLCLNRKKGHSIRLSPGMLAKVQCRPKSVCVCHLSLRVVQIFYTSQSLGSIASPK